MDCVNDLMGKLCEALFAWIDSTAASLPKYKDVLLLHNYGFFMETMGNRRTVGTVFDKYVSLAIVNKASAEERYVSWMISYEFPTMSSLADRIASIRGRVQNDELALYVPRYSVIVTLCKPLLYRLMLLFCCRKDVVKVFKDIDGKVLGASLVLMRKRLEKHCGATQEGKVITVACNPVVYTAELSFVLCLFMSAVVTLVVVCMNL